MRTARISDHMSFDIFLTLIFFLGNFCRRSNNNSNNNICQANPVSVYIRILTERLWSETLYKPETLLSRRPTKIIEERKDD